MKRRNLYVLVLCLFLVYMLVGLIGCGGQGDATPVEKASIASSNATKAYFALYDSYKDLDAMLTGKDLEKLHEKVAPVLNKAKKHLIAYNDLVIQWRESGGAEPVELIANEKLLRALIAEVSALLLEFV